MVRGAIEIAQRTRVVGWIHSGSEPLKGKVVLAFVGGRCVGSGEVDGFRKDLLDAKLGDGFCGFDFPVRLTDSEQVGSMIVRLQFSDMALLQPESRVVGQAENGRGGGPDLGALVPGRPAWLMDRGMLVQAEYDVLSTLQKIGAYTRSLRVGKPGSGEAAGQRIAPEAAAAELLGLVMMADVQVTRTSVAAIADIGRLAAGAAPAWALWSPSRGRLSLEEGSQQAGRKRGPAVLAEPPLGGVDHDFGPDRLLVLHRDCRFAPRGPAPASGLVVLTATAAATASHTETVLREVRVA